MNFELLILNDSIYDLWFSIDLILDRGITLKAIADKCYALGAKEVKIAVLCQKQIANFSPAINADYAALLVPDAYVFGYGMDYEGGWRNAPGIYELTSVWVDVI